MPVAAQKLAITAYRDASGGLNVRDAQGSLGANESPDLYNVTLDERGSVQKRLGYVKFNATAFGIAGDKAKQVFYWPGGAVAITQAGASLYKETGPTAFKTFTTAARCGLADFQGKLFIIHPADGLFSYDGTTVTAIADPDAPKGDTLSPWQNKLYAAGNPTNKPRVSWSAAGDGAAWAPADFNDLREKDSEKVVCLAGSAGVDVSGRQGLLAFKRESAYRIHDSTTGAYVTLDTSIGVASALAAVNVLGRTITVSQHGIFWTDGLSTMREASELIRPLFTPGRLNLAQLDLFAIGAIGDRVFCSVPQAGATANDLAFEYHPFQGWIVARSDAMAAYATYLTSAEYLIGGSPTVDGRVYRLNKGGSDDGAAIASRWQSRWIELGRGLLVSLIRLRMIGRGDASMYVRKDYANSGGDLRQIDIGAALSTYDTVGLKYDTGLKYGPSRLQEYQDFFSLGTLRAVSLVIEETSTIVRSGPQYLRTSTSPEVGAWGIYGFDAMHVSLGMA